LVVSVHCSQIGTKVKVVRGSGLARASVVERPFFDPKKMLAAA
jgi:hypothetical protein